MKWKSLVKRMIRRAPDRPRPKPENYVILGAQSAPLPESMPHAWHDPAVAQRQHDAWQNLLGRMRQGDVRSDLAALAAALRASGLVSPSLFEAGCGSGYLSEALDHLLGGRADYTGMDYAPAMIRLARAHYPDRAFFVGDATVLPLQSRAVDIVINGGALMHIPDYPRAIAESVRVARSYCIFHTVALLQKRPTTLVQKQVYGAPSIEVIYNRDELLSLFDRCGLTVVRTFPSLPYNLVDVLGETTSAVTFLCRVNERAR